MNRNVQKSRKSLVYRVITVVFVIAFGSLSWYAYDGSDTASGQSSKEVPVTVPSMIGTWKQSNSDTGDILAQAEITAGSIQINLKTRDSSDIYWLGSFDTDTDPAVLSEVTSLGDSDAMANSLFGSQDKTKKFAYDNGELTYKFTMLGTTKTVRLVKE